MPEHSSSAIGTRLSLGGKSGSAGLLLIHEPSLETTVYRLIATDAAIHPTVWILRFASSVIILHLLSMNGNHAALHKIADFLPFCIRRVSHLNPKTCPCHPPQATGIESRVTLG